MPAAPPKHMLFWLVVHGSYGPGGADHGRLSDLDGTWHPGSFSAVAGEQFADLVVKRYQDEPVRGWALQIAPKPDQGELQSMSAELFDSWAGIDEIFGNDVVRMDTTFQFDERQPAEGDVCRANTYGSVAMVPDGRYDAPHPLADDVALWTEVVADAKSYEAGLFDGLISALEPSRYDEVFGRLDNHQGFVARLRSLMQDQRLGDPSAGQPIKVSPPAHHHVDDEALIELARQMLATRSSVIADAIGASWAKTAQIVDGLQYEMAEPDASHELGDVHYDLAEFFADACSLPSTEPWAPCLAQACYSLAGSHDLVYWLLQDWSQLEADLEPLYRFWQAGGAVVVDIHGVAHVSRLPTR